MTYQTVTDKNVFELCGEAFGNFQNALKDLDARALVETIPHFHDTPKRYVDFDSAVKTDGDTYFITKYAEHNLVRARTQLKLASEMEKKFGIIS